MRTHRGVCETPGCENLQHNHGKNARGETVYRKRCGPCHYKTLAERRGMSVSDWLKQWHPYKTHRKNYCENARGEHAGWLPVPCVIDIYEEKFLHVDHLDGNHENNAPENLMTLCPTCHAVKTWIFDCVSHDNTTPRHPEMQHELPLKM